MNEIATQVAYDQNGIQGGGLIEGAPGSISDPPVSSFAGLVNNGSTMVAAGSAPPPPPAPPSSMGILNMAYQGLKAATMLERVEEVASVAQKQQQQQALLTELAGLQALLSVVSAADPQAPAPQGQAQCLPVSPQRKAQASPQRPPPLHQTSIRVSQPFIPDPISPTHPRHRSSAAPHPASGLPLQEPSHQRTEDEEGYSEDEFEEELVESYDSKSDIPEEEIIAEEGSGDDDYSQDAFESPAVSH